MSYAKDVNYSTAITASATTVVTPVIDISRFEKMCIFVQNRSTAINVVHLDIQVAMDASGTAASEPSNWISLPTASNPYASAVNATATIATTAVENCYNYLRFVARTTTTATAGILQFTIGGHQRF